MIAIEDEAADDVFSALSSPTARSILTTLHDQPRTASEVAAEVDTSLQNVNYHLNNLRDNELIEPVNTWYSDQGREMRVYAPTNEAIVLFAGDDIHRSSLLEAIKQLVGLVGIIALISVVIDRVVRRLISRPDFRVASTNPPIEQPLFQLPPGLLVFVGGLLALFSVFAWWYYRAN